MYSSSINSLAHQRGAIGLWGAVTLLLAVLFTALAVDSSRLWMQQRKLQSIADMASIQAARQIGCSANISDVRDAAQAAANANGYGGSFEQSPNAVQIGAININNGIRNFTPNAGQEAVRVYATQSTRASLIAGGILGGDILLNAEAVSSADPPLVAFSAGTFAASIDTEDSILLNGLLGGLLDSSLDLDVLSYQGLAATHLRLGDLYTAYGQIGGINQLLSTEMQLGELINLMTEAALDSGTANSQATLALQQIGASVNQNTTLRLGDILAVTSPDQDAVHDVNLNVLSLITAAAMFANEGKAINLPLAVNVPGIANVNALITLLEAPQSRIGPAGNNGIACTTIRTAQVQVQANVLVTIPLLAKIDLSLKVEVAQGSASLQDINDNGERTSVAINATPGIASISLTNIAGNGPARVSTILLNVPIADIELNLPLNPTSQQQLLFEVNRPATDNLPQTKTVSSSLSNSLENALGQSNNLNVTVLGLPNLVGNVVSTVISPLLKEIARVLLEPLLELLGIRLGGMDVTLEDVQLRQSEPLII